MNASALRILKMRKISLLLVPAFLQLLLAGCVSTKVLNDPARSHKGPDVASIDSDPDGRLYETSEENGVQVSYNLVKRGDELILRLILRNQTFSRLRVSPQTSIMDANGFRIPMDGYKSKLNMLSYQAGISGPSYVAVPTGGTGFSAGLAKGQAMGNNIAASYAQGVRARAVEEMRWMMAHWLNESYDLGSGEAAAGAVTFPVSGDLNLPLRVIVQIAGAQHEFQTKGASGSGSTREFTSSSSSKASFNAATGLSADSDPRKLAPSYCLGECEEGFFNAKTKHFTTTRDCSEGSTNFIRGCYYWVNGDK